MVEPDEQSTAGVTHPILIVEDSKAVAVVVQQELLQEGLPCEWMSTGEQALTWLTKNRCCLMLLDYRLPDMTAEELLHQFEEHNNKIPFIVMTGHRDADLAITMMKLGARDYLIKEKRFFDLLPAVVKRVTRDVQYEGKLA